MTTTILEVYQRYGVPFRVEATRNWVSAHCPFCSGSRDFHLGFDVARVRYSCWRCGGHLVAETLERLCRVPRAEALALWRALTPLGDPRRGDAEAQRRVQIHGYRRPSGVTGLLPRHRRYLEGRGFDPDEVEERWGVRATGPSSWLDGVDYSHRLLIPIEWEGREVSFQARDFTGRAALRYVSCPRDREAVHHKSVLYARPGAPPLRWAVVVEGATDCWRLGDAAVAVFGIKFTDEQVLAVARRCDRAAVAFDGGEPEAHRQARRLAARLNSVGCDSTVLQVPDGSDPGSMAPDDAAALVREVRRWASAI